MKQIIVFILVLIYGAISNAGTIDPSTSDNRYIDYGSKFNYVVKVGGTDQKDALFFASGVAIDPHHILTAGHVVKDSKSCFVIIQDKKYIISEVIIHKDFEKEFGIADIAIGYCEENLGLNFYPDLYDKDDEIGKICSISGYGLTGNFNTGSVLSDDKRRAGSNIVDEIQKDLLICSPSYKHTKGFTELEFLIASGDSGGGLFIDGKLAGINSCVMASKRSPNSKYNEESGHTRISKFIGWIHDNKRQSDERLKNRN